MNTLSVIATNPMFMEFLKKILAKDFAITALIPAALIATGECSREEPQPKLFPATIMSPSATFLPNSGRYSMKAIFPNCFLSVVTVYRPGVITSVFMSSPNFHALICNPSGQQFFLPKPKQPL